MSDGPPLARSRIVAAGHSRGVAPGGARRSVPGGGRWRGILGIALTEVAILWIRAAAVLLLLAPPLLLVLFLTG